MLRWRTPTLWRISTVRVESYWCVFFYLLAKVALLINWFSQSSGNFQLNDWLSKNFVKIKTNRCEINTIAILFRNIHSTYRLFLSKIWVKQYSALATRVTRHDIIAQLISKIGYFPISFEHLNMCLQITLHPYTKL